MTSQTRHVARVVIDLPTRALTEPFDYAVPHALRAAVGVGVPVLVPLGGTRSVGYVVELTHVSEHEHLRDIEQVLGEPLFDGAAMDLSAWIASEYAAPLSESLRLFLPPGGTPRLIRGYAARDGAQIPGLLGRAMGADRSVTDDALGRPGSALRKEAAKLETAGMLERTYSLQPARVTAASERFVQLTKVGERSAPPANATLQKAILAALSQGPVSTAELRAELGSVDGALRRLESLGAIIISTRERQRRPEMRSMSAPRHERLSAGQSRAVESIRATSSGGGGVVLLDGVTGSGKTEVYLRSIEETLACGRRSIVLVPEISLTPQTVGRFRSRFGDRVAVLHSRLSDGERLDQWRLALRGEVDVVVGARSALFAPLPDLGLVIIDEEHETSYKQSSSPRYHARDVARRLCESRGITLVLGSATPSMESMRLAETGAYTRVELPERVGGGRLPDVHVVDMGAEFADGHRSMFSRRLIASLEAVAAAGEKAVLFLNRRGYASFLLCRECGFVPRCDSCAVSLTYHEQGNALVCHHCGSRSTAPTLCPRCNSPYLRRFGAGTQRVEEELASLVPGLPVVRMDADTTKGKGGHERALMTFESLSTGVLLGTQMVAKGLDYPEVTLVGVINADTTMHVPDFRASERTYQLLQQVAGRAGRGDRSGQVVIQTYWPEHPAVRAVAQRCPDLLYLGERTSRAELGYPPFGRLANLLVSSTSADDARATVGSLRESVERVSPADWTILGPAPAPIARLKGRFRWHLLVKAAPDAHLGEPLREVLERVDRNGDTAVIADIDPFDLL